MLSDGSTMVFAPVATAAAAAPVAAATTPLTAQPWQWESYDNEEFRVHTPAQIAATFSSDGSLKVAADCNNAAGSYTDDGGR